MRIAIFTESFTPFVNGVSISVETLKQEMERRGHQVYVFAPCYPGYTDPVDGVFRFPSRAAPSTPNYPLAIPFSPRLHREFRNLKVDIVHTQTPFFLGMLGLKWGHAARKPVVTTNHTQYPEYTHYLPLVPYSWSRAAMIWHMRRYYSACDGVVVPSEVAGELLRSYGISNRIEVIATGVEAPDLLGAGKEEVRAQYGIPQDAPLLAYVGRLAVEKNLGLLMDSFQEVGRRIPRATLIVVGDGPMLRDLRAGVKSNGLGGQVFFTGGLPQKKVWDILRAADLFAFPSSTETQGLAICEALSTGLPCVVVNEGGSREVVEDGEDGLLVPSDTQAFTSAIIELLTDERRRMQMSRRALELCKQFSRAHMADEFEAFYQSYVGKD
jgi:1,2-diacylglycerol 3-alpha-glucosyltransferase